MFEHLVRDGIILFLAGITILTKVVPALRMKRFTDSALAGTLGVATVYAIVSDRHLQGVSALECDLESYQSEFRMLVNAKKHTLQLENDTQKITYEEVSEDTMRFALKLPEAPLRICELQFPAGALVCTSEDGRADLGFCLTV